MDHQEKDVSKKELIVASIFLIIIVGAGVYFLCRVFPGVFNFFKAPLFAMVAAIPLGAGIYIFKQAEKLAGKKLEGTVSFWSVTCSIVSALIVGYFIYKFRVITGDLDWIRDIFKDHPFRSLGAIWLLISAVGFFYGIFVLLQAIPLYVFYFIRHILKKRLNKEKK